MEALVSQKFFYCVAQASNCWVWFHAEHMNSFGVERNLLDGPLPEQLCSCTGLRIIRAFQSGLAGMIPVQVGELRALSHLLLAKNDLEEGLPDSIESLVLVEELDFGWNTDMYGVLPEGVSALVRLEILGLDHTLHVGSMNPLSGLENLRELR
eukprot:2946978-Amphidinium_carterae.1